MQTLTKTTTSSVTNTMLAVATLAAVAAGAAALAVTPVQKKVQTYRAACVLKDNIISMPKFTDSDSGVGYVKYNLPKAVANVNQAQMTCTKQIYDMLMANYCDTKSNVGTLEEMVVIYDSSNNVRIYDCDDTGCSAQLCLGQLGIVTPTPNAPNTLTANLSAPASSGRNSGPASGPNRPNAKEGSTGSFSYGICMVKSPAVSLPNYNSSDTGLGYAKISKGLAGSYAQLEANCSKRDYANLIQNFCANTKTSSTTAPLYMSYQKNVVLYDAYDLTPSKIDCGDNKDCNYYQCATSTP
jgi:hypothetical protein